MLKKIKTFIGNKEEYYPNLEIFGYHVLKAIKKLFLKIGILDISRHNKDMFDWPLYHLHYRGELKENAKKYTISLKPHDYEFKDNELLQKNFSIKPLHFSHRFLYETIVQLKPQSVFEMGCGTGVNMHNISILLPFARIYGVDLLDNQLDSLFRTYPHLKNSVKQNDATIPYIQLPFEKCELAFTQAVIMHIHTDNSYLVALENLFSMSNKYVILMEGIRTRNYKDDIQKLFDEGKIKWNKIFFYYRINKEIGLPNGIICSNEPLKYLELTDYNIFYESN